MMPEHREIRTHARARKVHRLNLQCAPPHRVSARMYQHMINPPDVITFNVVILNALAFQETDFADYAGVVGAEKRFTDPRENKAAIEEPIGTRRAQHAATIRYCNNAAGRPCQVI